MSDKADLENLFAVATLVAGEVRSGPLSRHFTPVPKGETIEGTADGWGLQIGRSVVDPKLYLSVYVDRIWGEKARTLWIGFDTESRKSFERLTSSKLPVRMPSVELTNDDFVRVGRGQYRVKKDFKRPTRPTLVFERYHPENNVPGYYLGFYSVGKSLTSHLDRYMAYIQKIADHIPVPDGWSLLRTEAPSGVDGGVGGPSPVQPVDWLAVCEAQIRIGRAAEQAVVDMEQARIRKGKYPHLASQVSHVSKERGDGAGYDIESFDDDGEPILIEVKATTSKQKGAPFYITNNEYEAFKKNGTRYRIYRLYGFSPETKKGSFYIIDDHRSLELRTQTYQARFSHEKGTQD